MTLRLLVEAFAIGQIILAIGTGVAVLSDRRYRASSAISWLLLIAAIPVGGAALYWLAGKPWLSRRRLARSERIRATLERPDEVPRSLRIRSIRAALSRMPEGTRGLAVLAGQVSGQPPVGGNEIEFLADTDDLMHRVAADIDVARESVHVLFYIALDDGGGLPVMEAMIRAAQRGVTVRFLVDSIGSRTFARGATRRRMEEAGVHVVEALAAGLLGAFFERVDLRNHRKIVVIDGKVGYIGSHNLAAATFKVKKKHLIWVDATCRLEGPIANELQRVFAEDWSVETMERLDESMRPSTIEEGGVLAQVVATGPLCDEGSMPQVLVTCIHLAQREIVLTTPYFVPDEPTMMALIGAARRGVRVQLVVPEHNDSTLVHLASKSFFGRLLEAGVELLEFKGGMLHAKTITIDDRLSVMTSSNLDRRSFEINFEVSLILYDQHATQAMRNLQESYMERSVVISREEWAKRSRWRRILENAVGLASPVL